MRRAGLVARETRNNEISDELYLQTAGEERSNTFSFFDDGSAYVAGQSLEWLNLYQRPRCLSFVGPCAGYASVHQHHRRDPTLVPIDKLVVPGAQQVILCPVSEQIGIEMRQQAYRISSSIGLRRSQGFQIQAKQQAIVSVNVDFNYFVSHQLAQRLDLGHRQASPMSIIRK